jgi:hypothetical protein
MTVTNDTESCPPPRPSGSRRLGPADILARVEILLWLVPPAVVTALAMLWATWAGRDRPPPDAEDSEAAYDRFARALQKPHPTAGKGVGPAPRDVASGVAVRRSRPTRDARPRR